LSVATGGDTVKIVGLGTAIITARQPGNYLYSAAPDSSRTIIVSTKITLIAKADDKAKTYGDANPSFTISYTGFVNNDNSSVITTAPTVTTTATTASSVGSYDLTLGTDGVASNYTIVSAATLGKLTISKASLTAKADDKTKTYGEANPAFTISYTGFVNNDNSSVFTTTPTVTTTATAASSVGSYDLTLGADGVASNYTIVPAVGKLNISKATLTAKADDKTKTYGDANPSFTISYTGFVNNDNSSAVTTAPTVTTTATAASSVGSYDLTVETNGEATNYNIVPAASLGKLTINKADLTAKADDKTKTYGENNPSFTISYTGFVNNDNNSAVTSVPTITTSATAASSVGSYDLTVGTDGEATNYNIVPAATLGKLNISKANLTAKADDKTKTYGEANPSFTISYTGFVNNDNSSAVATAPTVTTNATAASSVGSYDLTVGTNGVATNYNIVPALGKLTINKANLTAKADDMTRKRTDANPAFTITYSGFVNSDTKANITEPVISCTASTNSAAGTYPITLSGGSATNYNITLSNGTLTITSGTPVNTLHATEILIYPNPASNVLKLKRVSSLPETLMIFDTNGAKVIEKKLLSDEEDIDVTQLLKGTYILKLEGTIYKVVVQ
jgi:hypothetical protein